MSIWKNHSVELRIREILASVPESEHHFGRPFLSAYQIAIAFDQRYRPAGRRSLRPESPQRWLANHNSGSPAPVFRKTTVSVPAPGDELELGARKVRHEAKFSLALRRHPPIV